MPSPAVLDEVGDSRLRLQGESRSSSWFDALE